jgi:hypothetical protein
MFMRYRGGGVGHLYMRLIEVWLAETGWGANDDIISTNEDTDEEEDSKSSGDSTSDGDHEDDTVSNGTTDLDSSDIDPDAENMSSENDEETIDGKYGFSGL